MAVNNLVHNAFEHAFEWQGAVTIAIRAHELVIINPMSNNADERYTPTDTPSSHGYGLGLGIVERLCERNGWSFSLNIEETRVSARLAW
nr:ATP-binding protein [Idiomarina sp.]